MSKSPFWKELSLSSFSESFWSKRAVKEILAPVEDVDGFCSSEERQGAGIPYRNTASSSV